MISKVQFPTPRNINVNMMPIRIGEPETLPDDLKPYLPMIEACGVQTQRGKVAYLTVHESWVEAGQTQRRPGVHTEATPASSWGGGRWGGTGRDEGVYFASTDGACRVWDDVILSPEDVDDHGGLLVPLESPGKVLEPNTLYWITDRTPHEALPSPRSGVRQYFRLVAGPTDVWFTKHCTPNPLGVMPEARIVDFDKFENRV